MLRFACRNVFELKLKVLPGGDLAFIENFTFQSVFSQVLKLDVIARTRAKYGSESIAPVSLWSEFL